MDIATGGELSERTERRAQKNEANAYAQIFMCTALITAIAVPVIRTLSVSGTIQSTACELRAISNVRQVGDTSKGECVRGRTQWDATATVYMAAWQQIRNATASEQCEQDFDTGWDLGSSYTCEYTTAGVMRIVSDSRLANGEPAAAPTTPIFAYLAIGWLVAVDTPFLLYACYRALILGCRKTSEDKKKLANPSVVVGRLGLLQVLGSLAFIVLLWIENIQQFQWAE